MSFKNFLGRLDITNKRICDPEVGSIEIVQNETKRKKKKEWRNKNRTEYPKPVEEHQSNKSVKISEDRGREWGSTNI